MVKTRSNERMKKKSKRTKSRELAKFYSRIAPVDSNIIQALEKHGYKIEQIDGSLIRYNIRNRESQRFLGYLDKKGNEYRTKIVYNPESIKQIIECLSLRDFCDTNKAGYLESVQYENEFKKNEFKEQLRKNFDSNNTLEYILEKL